MRRPLPLLLLAALPAALAAQAPAPGAGQLIRIPGMSPAGLAALNGLSTRQDPAVVKQIGDERALNARLQATLAARPVDVDKLAAILAQKRAVQLNAIKIGDDHLLIMLRAVPAGDRPALLAALTPQRSAGAAPAARR